MASLEVAPVYPKNVFDTESGPDTVPLGTAAYKYESLPNSRSHIRIFILQPGEGDEPLQGKLVAADATLPQVYEPLSYVWGDANRCHQILIHGEDGQMAGLGATSSLHHALQRLRLLDRERRIWCDQISINQDDNMERSQQVQFMTRIYKNASRVLVWLSPDNQGVAKLVHDLILKLHEIFQDEIKLRQFHTDHTRDLEKQSRDTWAALDHLTDLSWCLNKFTRCWIVQEIGFDSPATLFWGDVELDWKVLHEVCEQMHHYQYLRSKFNLRTALIKYAYQRFIEPARSSYHANRFSFIYELNRARGLKVTDPRDRVFAFLGHFSVRASGTNLAAITADYDKSIAQVYTDVAGRTLCDANSTADVGVVEMESLAQNDAGLITLSAIQHMTLPSSKDADERFEHHDADTLPSWVPDWRVDLGFILNEPIHPRRAQGTTSPELSIDQDSLILSIHGVRIDTVKHCSRPLERREFERSHPAGDAVHVMQYLWHDVCDQQNFSLTSKYRNGDDSKLFAFMQTLSNGCIQNAHREERPYHEISKLTWLAHQAAYLLQTIGQSDTISTEIQDIAKTPEAKEGFLKWSRVANAASTNRIFATTTDGFYVLGPKVMEAGDIICVLFGGKMPFCLRPWGDRFLLVGDCYVHGLMEGEAIEAWEMGEFAEEVFNIV